MPLLVRGREVAKVCKRQRTEWTKKAKRAARLRQWGDPREQDGPEDPARTPRRFLATLAQATYGSGGQKADRPWPAPDFRGASTSFRLAWHRGVPDKPSPSWWASTKLR